MSGYIDLHTHSSVSDGSMTPGELVRYAHAKRLRAIALTDHDTVDGIEEALREAERLDFELVPGLEISVDYKREMHILAYFTGCSYRNMEEVLFFLRRSREERNPKIIRKLNEMGFEITLEEVVKEARGQIVGRPHIARAMFKKGYVTSMVEAFDRYLSSGRPAYYKKEKLTPAQGIREIANAGGIPVLAHPMYLGLDFHELDRLIEELKAAGLKGVEAFYVDNTPEQTLICLKLAEKHNLLVTGGSDFHGAFKPDIEIGTGHGNLQIPYELLEKMKSWST